MFVFSSVGIAPHPLCLDQGHPHWAPLLGNIRELKCHSLGTLVWVIYAQTNASVESLQVVFPFRVSLSLSLSLPLALSRSVYKPDNTSDGST